MDHAVSSKPEMHEGEAAFDRFRKAMRTIVTVPKTAVTSERKKTAAKKKRAAK